jgi:tetratricopeptide (TPR) repeat protein
MKETAACIDPNRICKNLFLCLGVCCLSCFAGTAEGQSNFSEKKWDTADAPNSTAQETPMLRMLKDRVIENPENSETWRLIGRLERKQGNLVDAIEATGQSLALDPLNTAANFDFAELMAVANQTSAADKYRQRVFAIAPDSHYANELKEQGFQPNIVEVDRLADEIRNRWSSEFAVRQADGATILDDQVSQVDYQIQTFDGSDNLENSVRERVGLDLATQLDFKPLRFFIETGALYNTNVSLTPISFELARSNAASAQFFAAPELEWTIGKNSGLRYGTLTKGYFTVNEHQWSAFNLASFQPGAFLEKELSGFDSELIGRLDYSYALDIVAGNRLGDRHSIMGSLIQIRPDLDVIYGYLNIAFSQFDDDGTEPPITSLDGSRLTAGISRFYRTGLERMPTWILGVDIENAKTEGANFRYSGLTLHTSTTIQLTPQLSFVPDAGVGGRNYYDFTGPVDRDEITWRVGGKLGWQYNKHFNISIVAGHNRFASDNEDFDAERSLIGIITTYAY